MSWPWSQLGLPGPSELSEVRHAYAEKLKTTHPEEDPEGFLARYSDRVDGARRALWADCPALAGLDAGTTPPWRTLKRT